MCVQGSLLSTLSQSLCQEVIYWIICEALTRMILGPLFSCIWQPRLLQPWPTLRPEVLYIGLYSMFCSSVCFILQFVLFFSLFRSSVCFVLHCCSLTFLSLKKYRCSTNYFQDVFPRPSESSFPSFSPSFVFLAISSSLSPWLRNLFVA